MNHHAAGCGFEDFGRDGADLGVYGVFPVVLTVVLGLCGAGEVVVEGPEAADGVFSGPSLGLEAGIC